MSEKPLNCAPNPCNSCPYRKDTPPGIWDKSEYDKLPAWDDKMSFAGVFHCHNAPDAVCRGWLEVHQDNMSVRMTMFRIKWDETNEQPTKIPLYASGEEARRAGIRGIKRPGIKAREKIQHILSRRNKVK